MATLATTAAFGFSDFNPPTLLQVYRRMGCKTLQFYRNTKNPPTVAHVKQVAADLGMPIDSVHGVFGPEHDPSSPDEPTRQAAMRTYREEGQLAAELGGPAVVVHPAPMAPDPTLITDASRQVRVDPMRRSLEELGRIGEQLGVTYHIENIPANYYFGSDARLLAQMIRALNHRRVRMCFDTGHANMTTTTSAAEDLAACLDVIGYFHINDNDGKTDSHLIPGYGTCPWDAIGQQIARLPDDVPVMLELFYSEQVLESEIDKGLGQRLARWLAIGAGRGAGAGSQVGSS